MRIFSKFLVVSFFISFLTPNSFAVEKKTAVPGLVGVYRLVTAPAGPYQGDLVIDLGFSQYFKFGNMKEFKAGELIHAAPVKPSKKGLATRFHFKRVHPPSYLENVHLNVGDQYVVADESSLYTYPAYLTEILEADTFKAILDLGFGIMAEKKLRLEAPAETWVQKLKSSKQLLVKVVNKQGEDGLPVVQVWTEKNEFVNRPVTAEAKK